MLIIFKKCQLQLHEASGMRRAASRRRAGAKHGASATPKHADGCCLANMSRVLGYKARGEIFALAVSRDALII